MTQPPTIGDLLARASAGHEALVALGEEVEDEWGYVQDLAEAWRTALDRVADVHGREPAASPMVAAIDRLLAEVELIGDPHRAIDWLSTFPQAVLLALGSDPWDATP